jgi:hypothetical protein
METKFVKHCMINGIDTDLNLQILVRKRFTEMLLLIQVHFLKRQVDRSRKRIYEYILMNITSKSYVNVLSRSESCKEKSASSKMAFLF